FTPTGSVTFNETGPAGSFSSATCTLASGSCSVAFTATSTGTAQITGAYGGDAAHSTSTSAGASMIINPRATSTTVVCTSPVVVNQASNCTATVTDNAPGTLVTPIGDVSFTTNSTGTFSSNSCTLSGTGTSGVASCQVTYSPISVATHSITGTYSGDTIHLSSQGSASIGFGKDSTTTSVNCSPSSVAINQATTCTVTVTDTSSTGPKRPTGTVSFTSN